VLTLSGRPAGGRTKGFLSLLAGVLLLNFPELLDVLAQTFFGHGSDDVLSYRAPGGAGGAASFIRLAFLVIALTGLIGVARGVYILRLTGGEAGGLPRALAHIVGGVLCVNIVPFLKILAASLGGDVEAVISALIG
jgi:hypothetical protein